MLDEQQERLVAQGLRDGRIDAWQTLYDAFAERVWRGVARLLGPKRADVADVVQEAMMAAARSAATFDPERGGLWPWLWGIAHNHVLLHLRKQQRRAEVHAGLAQRDGRVRRWLEGDETAAPQALEAVELAAQVRATLTALPADYGELLAARYLDGDSVALIAVRERSTDVAVRSRLARARQAFREAFE